MQEIGSKPATPLRYQAALEEEGIGSLLEKARNKARINNRVAPEIEERVLSYLR